MKKATQIMYKLAKIFSTIFIVCMAICIFSGIFMISSGVAAIADPSLLNGQTYNNFGETVALTGEVLVAMGIVFIIFSLIYIAAGLVLRIFAGKAYKAFSAGTCSKKLHIINIVLGALTSTVFPVLGGIFGLIYQSRNRNAEVNDNAQAE